MTPVADPGPIRVGIWTRALTAAATALLLFHLYVLWGLAYMAFAHVPYWATVLVIAGPVVSVCATIIAVLRPIQLKLAIFNGCVSAAYAAFWLPQWIL